MIPNDHKVTLVTCELGSVLFGTHRVIKRRLYAYASFSRIILSKFA